MTRHHQQNIFCHRFCKSLEYLCTDIELSRLDTWPLLADTFWRVSSVRIVVYTTEYKCLESSKHCIIMLEEPQISVVHRKHEMFENVQERINLSGYQLNPCIGGPIHPTSSSVYSANIIRLDAIIEFTSSDVVFYMVSLCEYGYPYFCFHILWRLRNTELASCKYVWYFWYIMSVGFEQVSLARNQRQCYPEASIMLSNTEVFPMCGNVFHLVSPVHMWHRKSSDFKWTRNFWNGMPLPSGTHYYASFELR